ncbi:fatty acid-binding protein, intestinal-like [Microcebus murinus]|uniref:fatty acid-binding protein, intestinal-like n=1 Tax=Microcebus murinus TaxID=30608 RepID=UPI003F6B93C1
MAPNATWKVDRSENYDKFMEKMDINVLKRKAEAHDNVKLRNTQEGNKFTVEESSIWPNGKIVSELAVSFNYTLEDGTEVRGTWIFEGNKPSAKFKRLDNGKECCQRNYGRQISLAICQNDSMTESSPPEQCSHAALTRAARQGKGRANHLERSNTGAPAHRAPMRPRDSPQLCDC